MITYMLETRPLTLHVISMILKESSRCNSIIMILTVFLDQRTLPEGYSIMENISGSYYIKLIPVLNH